MLLELELELELPLPLPLLELELPLLEGVPLEELPEEEPPEELPELLDPDPDSAELELLPVVATEDDPLSDRDCSFREISGSGQKALPAGKYSSGCF